MCESQCIQGLTNLQSCAIVNLAGVCYNYGGVCGVMRKIPNIPNLQNFENEREIVFQIKKFSEKFFHQKVNIVKY